MFVELVGDDLAELRVRAMRCWLRRGVDGFVVPDPAKRWRCGRSGKMARAWRASVWLVRPIPAGRTRRCRRSTSAHTCATSTGYLMIMDWMGCHTVTSATDAYMCASTSR